MIGMVLVTHGALAEEFRAALEHGGTPSNLAISLLEKDKVEVVAGINLPMLIKLASVRDNEPLNVAVLEARDAARKYISVASEVLAGSQE